MSEGHDLFGGIPDPFAHASAAQPLEISTPADPGPTRAVVGKRRVIASVAALTVVFGWLAIAGPREGPSVPFMIAAVGLPILGAAITGIAATRSGRLGLGLDAAKIHMCIVTSFALFAASAFLPGALASGNEVHPTLTCGGLAIVLAALSFAFLFFAFRSSLATSSRARAIALGVAVGALAAAALRWHCHFDGASHVVLGHGAAMVLFGAVGALLYRR